MLAPLAAQPAAQSPPRDLKAIDAELAKLRAQRSALDREQKTLLGRLRELELAARERGLERERTRVRLASLGRSIEAARERLRSTDAELGRLRPEIEARLVRLYKLMPLGYERLLLSVDDARKFDRAARVVGVLARRDREQLEHFQRLRANRSAEVARLTREEKELAALQAQLAREQAALAETAAAQAKLLAEVRSRRDMTARLAAELDAARDRLDRSVGELSTTAPAVSPFGGGLRIRAGTMEWPVRGQVSAKFGRQVSSRFGTMVRRNGIDIATAPGTPVKAVQRGRVAFADAFTGFGLVVILDHGERAYTLYGHLADATVSRGSTVEPGQVIGTVGTSPDGEASLYFEVRVDGRPVDPVQWLKR